MKFSRTKGLMPRDEFLKTYSYCGESWPPRMTNAVINGIDYHNLSARKLFKKYLKVRPLADIEQKYRYQEPDAPLLPRSPIKFGWTAVNSSKKPEELIGIGLREMHRHASAPIVRRKYKGLRRDDLPTGRRPLRNDTVTNKRKSALPPEISENLKPLVPPDMKMQQFLSTPATGKAVGHQQAPCSSVNNLKPVAHCTDTKMRIPIDKKYAQMVNNEERLNYRIKKIWHPDTNPLSMGDDYTKAKYAMSHNISNQRRMCPCAHCNSTYKGDKFVIDNTTNWLSFIAGDIDPDKFGGIIDAFTNNIPPREYYMIETETGCLVAKQLDPNSNANIGINGMPSRTQKPISFREVLKEKLDAGDATLQEDISSMAKSVYSEPKSSYRPGIRDPRLLPLSHEDQFKKTNARIVLSKKKEEIKEKIIEVPTKRPEYERVYNKDSTKAFNPIDKEVEHIDLIHYTKQTRALNNRFIYKEDEEREKAAQKAKRNAFSYPAIKELIDLSKPKKEHKMHRKHSKHKSKVVHENNSALVVDDDEEEDIYEEDRITLEDIITSDHQFIESERPTSQRRLSSSIADIAKEFKETVHLSTSQLNSPHPQEQQNNNDFILSKPMQHDEATSSPRALSISGSVASTTLMTSPQRPHHGPILAKTASQGASFGSTIQGPLEFLSFVKPAPVTHQRVDSPLSFPHSHTPRSSPRPHLPPPPPHIIVDQHHQQVRPAVVDVLPLNLESGIVGRSVRLDVEQEPSMVDHEHAIPNTPITAGRISPEALDDEEDKHSSPPPVATTAAPPMTQVTINMPRMEREVTDEGDVDIM